MPGTQVWSFISEDPTYLRETKPVLRNEKPPPWEAHVPQQTVARTLQQESSLVSSLAATGESCVQQWRPSTAKYK